MSKKIELPDFDDMVASAHRIGEAKTALMVKKAELNEILAEITKKVTTNSDFWTGGKPPSNAHIKDSFHILGYDETTKAELIMLRLEIAELEGTLKTEENLFKIYDEMIGVWRTQSANERGTFLE